MDSTRSDSSPARPGRPASDAGEAVSDPSDDAVSEAESAPGDALTASEPVDSSVEDVGDNPGAFRPAASVLDGGDDLIALHPDVQTVWRIKLAGTWTFLFLIAAFYDLTHWLSGDGMIPLGTATGLTILMGTGFVWFWPRLKYRYWGYVLRPEELYLEHGVLNHVRTVVPLRRIQHLDVSQDIVEREFSLGRLVVHTAGSRSSDVVIPGLLLDTAESLRDDVKRHILDDPLMEDPV